MYIRIENPEIKEGYIPRLNVIKSVYLEEALVSVRDAKAYLQVINTNDEEEKIFVPSIKIYEFETKKNKSQIQIRTI